VESGLSSATGSSTRRRGRPANSSAADQCTPMPVPDDPADLRFELDEIRGEQFA
jgi:hypothetical protein